MLVVRDRAPLVPALVSPTSPAIGMTKAGLRISVQARPQQLIYRGCASPVLLYLVLGTALGLGAIGAITLSPEQGVVGSLTFSLLFSPVILFVIYGAIRLRSLCIVDRQRGLVRVRERSYRGGFQVEFPLDSVQAVRLAVRPETPIIGTSDRYGVYMRLPEGFFQVIASNTDAGAEREAERLAIFLGLPVEHMPPPEADDGMEARAPVPWGTWLTMIVMYAAPIAIAVGAVYFVFHDVPLTQRLMLTSLSAIILSQVGAILAFAYNRSQEVP